MTNEDAIHILLYMKHDVIANSSEDVALDTAIEALKSKKPKTNGDKIRAMTDEELAVFLNRIIRHCREESCDDGCPMADCCACDCDWQEKWLKQEVQEDAAD